MNQKYIETAENLLGKLMSSEKPIKKWAFCSDETEFGAVVFLYDIATRIGIADIIGSILPKRKQGVYVRTYILIASINRAIRPSSKSGLEEWYAQTCLPFITGHKPSALTPQNFWDNIRIGAENIIRIEEVVLKKVINTYEVDTSHIIYDAANFSHIYIRLKAVNCPNVLIVRKSAGIYALSVRH